MLSMLIIGAAAMVQAQTAPARPMGTTRTDLQRHDLNDRGREVLQARVDFEAGAFFPGHTHPGEEIIYVIAGTIEYQVGGKPVRLKTGDVLFVPKGTVHSARNIGAEPAAELATYVLEKGKPLTVFAK